MPALDLTKVFAGDWLGAAQVALATSGTALVLCAGLVALMQPQGFGFLGLATAVVAVTGAAFGGDITARIEESGDVLTSSLGVYPLTVTVVALAVGGVLFWRKVRSYPRAVDAVAQAARSAGLLALVLGVLTVVFRSELTMPPEVADFLDWNLEGKFGARTVSTTLLSAVYLFAVCSATLLIRRDWLRPRVRTVTDWLSTPVAALAASLVAATLVGVVVAVFALIRADDEEPLRALAVLLAVLPNLGLWAFLSGSGAGLRYHAGSSDASMREHEVKYLSGLAEDSNWVWLLPVATLLVLVAGAVVVVRRSRSVAEVQQGLLRWLLVTVLSVPFLVHFAAVHAHLKYTATAGSDEENDWASWVFGNSGWQAFLLVAVWGFVIAVVVASLVRNRDATSVVQADAAPDPAYPSV